MDTALLLLESKPCKNKHTRQLQCQICTGYLKQRVTSGPCACCLAHLNNCVWFVLVWSGSIKPALSSCCIFNKIAVQPLLMRPSSTSFFLFFSFYIEVNLPYKLLPQKRTQFRPQWKQWHVLFTTEDEVGDDLSRPANLHRNLSEEEQLCW